MHIDFKDKISVIIFQFFLINFHFISFQEKVAEDKTFPKILHLNEYEELGSEHIYLNTSILSDNEDNPITSVKTSMESISSATSLAPNIIMKVRLLIRKLKLILLYSNNYFYEGFR